MKSLDSIHPGVVRIRVNIPRQTYEHIMEMVELNNVTNSPDVVVAGCIDSIYDMTVSHDWKYEEEKNGSKKE